MTLQSLAANYMKAYKGRTINVYSGYCPVCLFTRERKLHSVDWPKLFEEGTVQPTQVLNAFDAGDSGVTSAAGAPSSSSSFRRPYFARNIINLNLPGPPCQRVSCDPICWICGGLLDSETQTIVHADSFPLLNVHKTCCMQCQHPGCSRYIETVKRYILPKNTTRLCSEHRGGESKRAFQPRPLPEDARIEEPEPRIPHPPVPHPADVKRPLQRVVLVAAAGEDPTGTTTEGSPKKKPPVPATTTTGRTVAAASTLVKNRLQRFSAECKSYAISGFFQAPAGQQMEKQGPEKKKTAPTAAPPRVATPMPPAPSSSVSRRQAGGSGGEDNRRFLRNKDTGEIYAYMKDNQWLRCDNNEPLFVTDPPSPPCKRKKFDFSPPSPPRPPAALVAPAPAPAPDSESIVDPPASPPPA
jgi:hypothetical protein